MSSTNLIELQKNYLLNVLDSVRTANGFKYLVLDEYTEKLVYTLTDKNELLGHVSAIERLDQMRKPQLSIEAVYLLEPRKFSINCLMADFTIQPARYKKAHLIFLPGLTPELEQKLFSNSSLKYNTVNMQTIHLAMKPLEQHVFVTDNVNALKMYYNKHCYNLVPRAVSNTVNALINLCIVTGEYPMVRYYSPENPINDSAALPKLIASQFQQKIDDYARSNSHFPPTDNQRPRSTLIIVDRTLDLFASILHEFTYQAMCFDLLDFVTNKNGNYENEYNYKAENEKNEMETKTTKLNENDPDWVSLRHLHILEASETLVSKVNELIAKNPLMVDRSNATNTTDLLYIVAHLKHFDEDRRRITAHKKLIDELLVMNSTRCLVEAADFEQECAANGINYEGDKVRHMANNLLDLLSNKVYKEGDKLRLILLYAIYRGGLIEKDVTKLLYFGGLIELRHVVISLFESFENLGFQLLKKDLKAKKFKKPTWHQIDNEGSFSTSRFRPAVKEIIETSMANTLDETVFPYVKDKPLGLDEADSSADIGTSLKNPRHKATWAKTRQVGYTPPRQRVIYFVAGGVTYSEMRTAYELSSSLNKDVIIGGDELLAPRDFINSVVELNADRKQLNLYADHKDSLDYRKVPEELLKVQTTASGKTATVPQASYIPQAPRAAPNPNVAKEEPVEQVSSDDKNKEKKRHKFTKFLR